MDPVQLKQTATQLLNGAESALAIVEALPVPAEVKQYVADAEAFVKDVLAFLEA